MHNLKIFFRKENRAITKQTNNTNTLINSKLYSYVKAW